MSTTGLNLGMRPEPEVVQHQVVAMAPAARKAGGAGFEALGWVLTILGCALGVLILITGMASAKGAPQKAVVCALSVACCVLPYCFARAVHHLRHL